MKKIAYTLLVIILISCLKSKETDTTILQIDPSKFKEGIICLSEIGNEIKYIPFENQLPIGIIYSYKITDLFIYASIKDVGVVRFTKEGKMNGRYGNIGRGPGEYVFFLKFTVDERTGTVYVMDNNMNDIEVYNKYGAHIRNLKLPIDDEGFGFSDIEYIGSSLFLAQSINMGHGEYDWLIMDTLGVEISKKLNPYPKFNGRIGSISTLSIFNNKILYWDNFKDTIFHISDILNYTPIGIFTKGELKLPMTTEGYNPVDVFFKNISSYMLLLNFLETNQFLILKYELNKSTNLTLINKKSGLSSTIKLAGIENGINNDLDNGLPFIPEKYFEIKDENYLAAFIQPYELISHITSEKYKNSIPKHPEKKKELEQLANSLDENDNPVLMIVKLKD